MIFPRFLRRPGPRLAVACLVVEAAVGRMPAFAQVVTTPAFTVGTSALHVDVAATFAGLYFVYGTRGAQLRLQRIASVASADTAVIVEFPWRGGLVVIAPLPTGGFTAGWRDATDVYGRFLDVLGRPDGSTFRLNETLGNGVVRVTSVASGTVIVWSEATPNGVVLKAQVGFERYVLGGAPIEWDVATTPNGGCVIVWRYVDGNGLSGMRAALFEGSGMPLGDPVELAAGALTLSGVAVDPVSGAIAVVGLGATSPDDYEIRALRFGAGGAPLGPAIVVDVTAGAPSTVLPHAAFDYGGDLYVVWGDHGARSVGVRARAFGSDGTPLGPTVALAAADLSHGVRTTRTADGRFVNAWIAEDTVIANVVSLCVPGSAICGDGVHVGACERCDDGALNDDTVPDACRSNCVPAHCGDGVIDAGEQCDDGNFTPCDGCSPSCESQAPAVCGDGVLVPACDEECDDGNAALLDGCTPACRLERIPGGGSAKTDCLAEWVIENPTTIPPYDKNGAINPKQRCVDGDTRCDFDGGTPGSCTFHLRVCGNDTNIAPCTAPNRLESWALERPSELQGTEHPWLATLRAAFQGSIPGAIIGPTSPDVCSDTIAITVPLRGVPGDYKPNRTKLKSRADDYADRRDKDTLVLECAPGS